VSSLGKCDPTGKIEIRRCPRCRGKSLKDDRCPVLRLQRMLTKMTDTNPGFTNYSASEAVARANSYSSWQTNMCMNYVWYQLSYAHTYGIANAYAGWDMAQRQHGGSDKGNPPAGAPVYWATDHPYGHVAISVGGGKCRSTDWPSKGKVGTVSISEMTNAWGMTLLGWTEDLCGDSIEGIGDDDMPLTDDDLNKIAAKVWAHKVGDVSTGTVMVRVNPGPSGIVAAVRDGILDFLTHTVFNNDKVSVLNLLRYTHGEAAKAKMNTDGV
jgi:hypothetical protein